MVRQACPETYFCHEYLTANGKPSRCPQRLCHGLPALLIKCIGLHAGAGAEQLDRRLQTHGANGNDLLVVDGLAV